MALNKGNRKKQLSVSSIAENDAKQGFGQQQHVESGIKRQKEETKIIHQRRLSLPNALDSEVLSLRSIPVRVPSGIISEASNNQQKPSKRLSLPGIADKDRQRWQSLQRPQLRHNFGRRRASIAVGESISELRHLSHQQQQTAPPRHKRRGSTISIGSHRRISRVSVECSNKVPDGDYGWVVVAAAFVVMTISAGFPLGFGIYFVEFLKVFNESKSKTSWIGSLLSGMVLIGAPLSSACSKRFGVRPVGFVGCLMTFVAMVVASTFATDVTSLMFSLSLFGGLGIGLIQTASFICVAFYFDKRQSFAMGITSAGVGAGFMCYPQLSEWLITTYGWRGALLISSAVILNCLVCFALMKPLPKNQVKPGTISWQLEVLRALQNMEETMDDDANNSFQGNLDHPQIIQSNTNEPKATGHDNTSMDEEDISIATLAVDVHKSGNSEVKPNSKASSDKPPHQMTKKKDNLKGEQTKDCLVDIDSETEQVQLEMASKLTRRKSKVDHMKTTWQHALDVIDFTFLCNPVFVYYVIMYSLTSAGAYTGYLYITDFGLMIGVPETYASVLLSILGLTSGLARIVIGKITDNPKIDPFVMYGVSFLICGVVTLLCPFVKQQEFYFCFAAILGTTTGIYGTLTPVLAVDLAGVDHMGTIMSIALLIGGVVVLTMVPFAGWLFDITQSYTATFTFSGAMFMASAVMALTLRRFAQCVNKNKDKV